MTTTQKSHYAAYAVTGEGEKTYWTCIGAAWPNKSGEGFNIRLTAMPLIGRIVLLPPKPDGQDSEGAASSSAGSLPAASTGTASPSS